jgi:hypothetical protein
MSGADEAKSDLDELRDRIRSQAAQRRADVAAESPVRPPPPAPWKYNWQEGRRLLQGADALTHISAPPQLSDSHGPKRWLSSLVAKVVIRLTRFMTNRQIDFNVRLLAAVRDMVEALHEIETRSIENQEQIRHLEACLTQLQLRAGGCPPGAERPAA